MIPAFTSSSLNLPMSASSFSSGILPASESLVAFTITMNRIAASSRGCPTGWSNGNRGFRQRARGKLPRRYTILRREKSGPAEPVISLVFPVAAGVGIRDVDRHDVLGILESELGRDPQLHGEAVLRRQDLVGEAEREQGLRVQRRRHVDARVVVVRALEAHVLRAQVGSDLLQERAEAHAAPLADRAPALDADMARDLRGFRQRVKLGQRPWLPFPDQSRELERVGAGLDRGDFALAIERVERK